MCSHWVSQYVTWIDTCVADADGAPYAAEQTSTNRITLPMNRMPAITTTGQAEVHTFHVEGDQDWVKFDVTEGRLYLLQTTHEATPTAPIDTVLWLYDVDGRTPITYSDNMTGPAYFFPSVPIYLAAAGDAQPLRVADSAILIGDSQIVWRADCTGTVYANVEPIPYLYGQIYGAGVRYRLLVVEIQQSFVGDQHDRRGCSARRHAGNTAHPCAGTASAIESYRRELLPGGMQFVYFNRRPQTVPRRSGSCAADHRRPSQRSGCAAEPAAEGPAILEQIAKDAGHHHRIVAEDATAPGAQHEGITALGAGQGQVSADPPLHERGNWRAAAPSALGQCADIRRHARDEIDPIGLDEQAACVI